MRILCLQHAIGVKREAASWFEQEFARLVSLARNDAQGQSSGNLQLTAIQVGCGMAGTGQRSRAVRSHVHRQAGGKASVRPGNRRESQANMRFTELLIERRPHAIMQEVAGQAMTTRRPDELSGLRPLGPLRGKKHVAPSPISAALIK